MNVLKVSRLRMAFRMNEHGAFEVRRGQTCHVKSNLGVFSMNSLGNVKYWAFACFEIKGLISIFRIINTTRMNS